MLPAVKLNRKRALHAVEIDYVTGNWDLPPELEPTEATIAQP